MKICNLSCKEKIGGTPFLLNVYWARAYIVGYIDIDMEEIGIVREINGIRAVITVPKKGSCESCPGSSLCETLGAGEAMMEAYNHVDARVGDTVKVVFRASTYLKGTILVYGLPSLMLIIGAVLGREYLSRIFPSANPDLASAAGGFGLFAVSFLILKLWSIIFDRKKEYMPIIEEIINRGESCQN